MSIIQRIARRLAPRPDQEAVQREAERQALFTGFRTKTVTVVNRKQRRALGMTRAFTVAGGRSGWIVSPGFRYLRWLKAVEEKRRGQEGN